MKLAITQPYMFPYLGYFQLVQVADRFIIYDDVNYIKKGWINRNYILLNSDKHRFTVPLQKVSQNRLIKETHINEHEYDRWKDTFIKIVVQNYAKAPNFDQAFSIIRSVLDNLKGTKISNLATKSIFEVVKYLDISTKILLSSNRMYNNKQLKGQNRIIDICVKENATQYFNLIGGQNLYDKTVFKENNLTLKFLKMKNIQYQQFNNNFVPSLSIIDVMMFNRKTECQELLNQYSLI